MHHTKIVSFLKTKLEELNPYKLFRQKKPAKLEICLENKITFDFIQFLYIIFFF